MADDFDPENEIMVGNKRMRKIKRPKQHIGPLTSKELQAEYQQAAKLSAASYQQEEPQEEEILQPDITTSQPVYIEEDPYAYEETPAQEEVAYDYNVIEKKKALWIAIACVFLGLLAGKLFFGSSQVVQNGLQGVIINPEVPKGRSRCGVVEKTQGCVLYIMNPQRQELNGRDFYDLASQLTGRQRFVIETGNMRYSSVKIKPGAIAQLNIPPLQ